MAVEHVNFFAGFITFGIMGAFIVVGMYLAWKEQNKE
jgi:hypothetical protein